MSAISAEDLSRLIGLIYDTAIAPDRWPDALEAIRTELRAANSMLSLHKVATGQVLLNVSTNIPQDYADRVPAYSADIIDGWGGLPTMLSRPPDQPVVMSVINPDALHLDRTRNRYVHEWAAPQGLVDVIAILLAGDAQVFGGVAFGRHRSEGLYGDRETRVAALLTPHLQRAATINRLLDLSALARTTFEATLGTLATPVLLVTGALAVVHANPAARALLDEADVLRLRDGRLVASPAGVARALSVAVDQAGLDESVIERKGFGIPFRRRDGKAGALHVLPLRRGRSLFGGEAVAAVFVARSDRPFVAPTGIVAELFGLTPAEARVFDQLVAGASASDVSRQFGIELTTTKTHIQRIYDKVGVRRQVDLVMLAASLAPPSAPG